MQRLSERKNDSWLGWFLRGILILGILILTARLVELQIIKGSYYRDLAEGNRIKKDIKLAPRGKIYARGGELLEGEDFAHITGFIAETNENEVGYIDFRCPQKGPYRQKQIVGRGGLQQYYNCVLSGVDGEELWEVDSNGKNLRFLGKREAVNGQDLRTTIDYNLQKKVAEAMEGMPGSVVVSDMEGNIIALYSHPSYNPMDIAQSLKDKNLPLFNRAIGGLYHPGSIFKPLVAISALEEKKIDKDYRYVDTGVLTVKTLYGDYSYSNWYFTQYGGVEGEVDLVRALARSTDTFFYKIGELTGVQNMLEWVKKFGLTKLTSIDIPGEIESLIPSPDWKIRAKNEKWFLGNTYHFSIGQGDLALTPVGIHRAILSIANGGNLCDLKIASKTLCNNTGIKEENISLVTKGMIGACSSSNSETTGGTGYTFFDFPQKHSGITVACKTGTAETNDDNKTHAWFTVFAPVESGGENKILLTVMVENSGEGSKVAGPIARKILDFYFQKMERNN